MMASDRETTAQSDDKLRQRAFKQIIDICEDSISRSDIHMTIRCSKCAKCKTCKEIKKINASSYNDFMEQQVLLELGNVLLLAIKSVQALERNSGGKRRSVR